MSILVCLTGYEAVRYSYVSEEAFLSKMPDKETIQRHIAYMRARA